MTINREQFIAAIPKLYDEMKPDKLYDISLEPHNDKRSAEANRYLWKLLGLLSEKLNIPPLDIYKREVENLGTCSIQTIKEEAIESFTSIWQSRGTAWFVKIIDDSPLRGYKNIAAYYGSSCYTIKEMSRLIDQVVSECKEQGIETVPQNEIDNMLKEWKCER
jgi:hypothetical protein